MVTKRERQLVENNLRASGLPEELVQEALANWKFLKKRVEIKNGWRIKEQSERNHEESESI